jgi:transcriptional regulator with PAS, ATPase and Fis domain
MSYGRSVNWKKPHNEKRSQMLKDEMMRIKLEKRKILQKLSKDKDLDVIAKELNLTLEDLKVKMKLYGMDSILEFKHVTK